MSCPVHTKKHFGVLSVADHPHLLLDGGCVCMHSTAVSNVTTFNKIEDRKVVEEKKEAVLEEQRLALHRSLLEVPDGPDVVNLRNADKSIVNQRGTIYGYFSFTRHFDYGHSEIFVEPHTFQNAMVLDFRNDQKYRYIQIANSDSELKAELKDLNFATTGSHGSVIVRRGVAILYLEHGGNLYGASFERSSAMYLAPLNLTQYITVIDLAGGKLPSDIAAFTQAELIKKFEMKRLHAKKLRKWLDGHAATSEIAAKHG